MQLLLDTHVLLWALADSRKLGRRGRELLEGSHVFVSAASIWEISIKAALGKLKASPDKIVAALAPAGFESLPVSAAHAAAVYALPRHHRDPFDRLLLAQALIEGMKLLTNDDVMAAYGEAVLTLQPR